MILPKVNYNTLKNPKSRERKHYSKAWKTDLQPVLMDRIR